MNLFCLGLRSYIFSLFFEAPPCFLFLYVDAEVAAEVMQGAGNPDALNNYIWLLQQCSNNSATVGVWKLTDVLLDAGFTTQSLTLQNGTYGSLGEFYGYGGYAGNSNFWYGDWAAYTGDSNLDGHIPKWDYGTQWTFTLNKILTVPANNASEMAWYVLMTNLHETGWHDDGEHRRRNLLALVIVQRDGPADVVEGAALRVTAQVDGHVERPGRRVSPSKRAADRRVD